jgi:hypothetical protein
MEPIMINWKRIGFLVVVALIVLVAVAWHFVFGQRVTAHFDSISPDGMYRCTVTERSSQNHSEAEIVVFKRLESTYSSGEESWAEIQRVPISNDSACRAYYSIDWEYDKNYRTTKLIVFGNFSVPIHGNNIILFERGFRPPSAK